MSTAPDIVGHGEQIAHLMEDIRTGNVAHGYLFSGHRHLGKLTVAKYFAGELVSRGMDTTEKRAHLERIAKNIHPDVLTLDQLWIADECTDWNVIARTSNAPQQHRAKGKVKSDTIGIDDIRALQDRLIEKPSTGKLCCIIRSIERLHITAANALLKILEEPPSSCVFLLTTECISMVPETVVSRMRVLQFHPLPSSALAALLSGFAEDDRRLLLGLAQGCPGVIRRCSGDPDTLRRYRQLHIDAQHFLETRSDVERLKRFQELLKNGGEDTFLRHVFLHLQTQLRSPDRGKVLWALATIRGLMDFQQALRANVQKSVLAPAGAFSLSAIGEECPASL